jgi:uncharacterized OsmC-like protein
MTSSAIRAAIERTSAAIAADPAKAQAKNVPATARLREGLKFEVSGPYGERLSTDMPPAMGGEGSGPSPGWLLRGALASCAASVIAMRAAKLGVKLDTLEVTAESEADNRGMLGLDDGVSAGLRAVRIRVRIGGDTTPEVLRELVAWADVHSPVGCTVRQSSATALDVEVV